MHVHFKNETGALQTEECKFLLEGDHGVYLMTEDTDKLSYSKGYVKYEDLEYAEPSQEE